MSGLACPECGASGSDLLGHEIQGVYDGILFWQCLACGIAWPRDWGVGRRADIAASYVNAINASHKEATR